MMGCIIHTILYTLPLELGDDELNAVHIDCFCQATRELPATPYFAQSGGILSEKRLGLTKRLSLCIVISHANIKTIIIYALILSHVSDVVSFVPVTQDKVFPLILRVLPPFTPIECAIARQMFYPAQTKHAKLVLLKPSCGGELKPLA
jgi:hypothetical protein